MASGDKGRKIGEGELAKRLDLGWREIQVLGDPGGNAVQPSSAGFYGRPLTPDERDEVQRQDRELEDEERRRSVLDDRREERNERDDRDDDSRDLDRE